MKMSATTFDEQIEKLDLSIFAKIKSQLSDGDKRSLLSCQAAARKLSAPFSYLEIGSYLGGSIQPYLLDDSCELVYSIDKRPEVQPDERGTSYTYLNNSTQRMIELLTEVSAENIGKVKSVDGDTRALDPAVIGEKFDVCFIDGEHTDEAVLSDFRFCLAHLKENGAILFHDAPITYNGIAGCIEMLREKGIKFRAYSLPDIVFVIEINDFPIHQSEHVKELLFNNHLSYLYSLQYNDYYRKFANKSIFRFYRNMIVKFKGLNRFD